MECSCEVDTYDDDCEPVQMYSERMVRSRKDHKCGECRTVSIHRGDVYKYATYLFDGKWEEHKICQMCIDTAKHFFSGGSYPFGTLWDELGDYLNDNWRKDLPSDCISQLPPAARDRVCDILQEFQE
jgi:hypothetical protein